VGKGDIFNTPYCTLGERRRENETGKSKV